MGNLISVISVISRDVVECYHAVEDHNISIVRQYSTDLHIFKRETNQQHLNAVAVRGWSLKDINTDELSHEICLVAVQRCGRALRWIMNHPYLMSSSICMEIGRASCRERV